MECDNHDLARRTVRDACAFFVTNNFLSMWALYDTQGSAQKQPQIVCGRNGLGWKQNWSWCPQKTSPSWLPRFFLGSAQTLSLCRTLGHLPLEMRSQAKQCPSGVVSLASTHQMHAVRNCGAAASFLIFVSFFIFYYVMLAGFRGLWQC